MKKAYVVPGRRYIQTQVDENVWQDFRETVVKNVFKTDGRIHGAIRNEIEAALADRTAKLRREQ